MYDVESLRENSEPVAEYIERLRLKEPRVEKRLGEYSLEEEAVTKIRCHRDRHIVLVFSAEWCPDCFRNLPVLALLSRETGLEVRVFGGLMRDAKSESRRWRTPPSPREVEAFRVVKIPHIAVLNTRGEIVGEIVENPPEGETLEAAILGILES